MYTKYFTTDIAPLLPASKQHIGAFTIGDVLFDWTEVLVPKGTSKVIGAAMQAISPTSTPTSTTTTTGSGGGY